MEQQNSLAEEERIGYNGSTIQERDGGYEN
jgi:hypothetical protein